jgi:phosphinothricin acetyltransferase
MNTIVTLRSLTEDDLLFLQEIYSYYALNTTMVSFTQEMTIERLKSFVPINHPLYKSFIIIDGHNETCGFCYYARFKPREAFDTTVEISLYLKPGYSGKGMGNKALEMLEEHIRNDGFKNIIASITSENKHSMNLFEKRGFTCCGQMKNAAEKFGRKLDLMTYQKNL